MGKVSLLGSRLAKVGSEFVFIHPCEAAPGCPVARTCQNLTVGRRYRVANVRNIRHASCTEHEDGVQVVEVDEMPLVASFDASKLRGTLAKWSPPSCVVRGCPHWNTCFTTGMVADADYRLDEVGPKLDCAMGYDLRRVRVTPNKRPG